MPRQQELFDDFAREVIDVPVAAELGESFLAYSLSVITARAIPDVRDGLKPVQRRILHAMADMGLRPDRPHRKCAGVVGETMGKYHPHGDGSIYDALTKLGQDFSRNITLVDPHGNFGSLDDPPAAYRYTECRLSEAANEMLGEIDEDTVDIRPTFDGERVEPSYLPARLPNLLVNGTSGIAVGMATNMARHNLAEVHEAIKLVMTKRRPKPTVDELMAVLPGPDLPSGGVIVDDGLARRLRDGTRQLPDPRLGRDRGPHPLTPGARRDRAALPGRPGAGRDPHPGTDPRRRSCRWSPTSRTPRTATPVCASRSSCAPAPTPRRCSPSCTARPRSRRPSGSTTSCSSTATRPPSGSTTCATTTSSTASTSCGDAPRSASRRPGDGSTWSRGCSSRSTRSTSWCRSSDRPRTSRRRRPASSTSCRSPTCRPCTSWTCSCVG